MFALLIEFHPMVGVDLHKNQPPPPAPPVPAAPHAVAATLNWQIPAAMASTVRATFAEARIMQRGTDIQAMLPHIPLSPAALLTPAIIATSGSKSYFGPATVLANDAPIAVAVGGLVDISLNCGDVPTPTGNVVAPNTVIAGMTFGDVLGGVFAMAFDTAAQAAMNKVTGDLFQGPNELSNAFGSGLAGALLGSPLGFSFNSNGVGVVGLVGRLLGQGGNVARSLGEAAGGDGAQAGQDASKAGEAIVDDVLRSIAAPISGWNLLGAGGVPGDVERLGAAPAIVRGLWGAGEEILGEPAPAPAPLAFSGLDNPEAELF